jgi:hypothetical protein
MSRIGRRRHRPAAAGGSSGGLRKFGGFPQLSGNVQKIYDKALDTSAR